MLRHKENLEATPIAHVTPEELATAVSRIEARKDTDQRRADGTIPIGEAVQQLGLAVTPEEILSEVRAARASKPKRRLGLRDRFRVAALVVLSLLGGEAVYSLYGPPWAWISRPADQTQAVTFIPALVDMSRHIHLDPSLLVGNTSGELVLLSEVGDDQPVHCGYGGGAFQQYSPGGAGVTWTLIKHGGRIYIRGWMLKMSPKALAASGASISANRTPSHVVPVTLPMNRFMETTPDSSGTLMYSNTVLPVEGVHLDKHAYEKWNQ